ncbi:MAG: glucose-6-phosphate isomerase [Planctomycetota bacterium]|nr:glucose-6-phosphate isomerase [Planctomycetota bacterium]
MDTAFIAQSGKLGSLQEYGALMSHAEVVRPTHLRTLFATDPTRASWLCFEGAGMRVDHSRQRIDRGGLRLLFALARARGVEARRDAMWRGERINITEDRSVLHVALRAARGTKILVDGRDVVADVHEVLDRMAAFSRRVRDGSWVGWTGKRIRAVVNIGIGGSDLGPAMAALALRPWSDRSIAMRFVSNVDGDDFAEQTADLDPESTLFIVASKTFTTLETMTNATTAREWSLGTLKDPRSVAKHFVAVSTNGSEVSKFGIDTANMFGFWDWVGGRYSMDSSIGLSTMIAIGPEQFDEMLAGFREMDDHFRTAPLEQNLPVIQGLLGIWNRNFLGFPTLAVVPYSHLFSRFPAYLQQLEMESNGKFVCLDGSRVTWETCPVVWGETGTNSQHAYFQMLHQGSSIVPMDLIGFRTPAHSVEGHQPLLMANILAQAQALSFGRTSDEVRKDGCEERLVAARTFEGNRPISVFMQSAPGPRALGRMVAMYEHKVFTQGVIWGIDSFDQWGVELGKKLAVHIAPDLEPGSKSTPAHDPATNAWIHWLRES